MYASLFFAVRFVVTFESLKETFQFLKMICGSYSRSYFNLFLIYAVAHDCTCARLYVNTNLQKYKNSFDSSNDRLDTKILSHVNVQLSATGILNLVAWMNFWVALASGQPLVSSPVTLCLDLVTPFIFVMRTGGAGISQMGQQGWSGAGQRDYHYSLYNKRKFEEVWWAHA